jgi:DNA-binding NtrC family response regulator
MRDGAVDYVTKPFDPVEFARRVVAPIAERRGLRKTFDRARAAMVGRATGAVLVAESPAMRAVMDRVQVLANTDAPVLVIGDRGTGKKLVARAIHAQGPRREGPLVLADGMLLADLLLAPEDGDELELRPEHRFREAIGGTLVLEGVERLSTRAQGRLLRTIDAPGAAARRSPWWHPLGIRVITLSRESLADRATSGQLLESLYYRLNGVQLHVPALEARAADLCPLVVQLIQELEAPGMIPPALTPAAWKALSDYAFPGNVRELRWILEHAMALADGGPIDLSHLPSEILGRSRAGDGVTVR